MFGYLVNSTSGNARVVMPASVGSQLNASKLESMLGVQCLNRFCSDMVKSRLCLLALERLLQTFLWSQGLTARAKKSHAYDLSETRYCKC